MIENPNRQMAYPPTLSVLSTSLPSRHLSVKVVEQQPCSFGVPQQEEEYQKTVKEGELKESTAEDPFFANYLDYLRVDSDHSWIDGKELKDLEEMENFTSQTLQVFFFGFFKRYFTS